MRLTLRTLLAYLDDVLEPTQTREIGKKIQESPLAAAQMSRIREVIRRRRLGAPELEGAGQGIDPNLVAEYLDNTLGPEQVADIERVCLESDVQLAEAAACHQILTLVLGEPIEVPPQRLDRYYALGPVASDAQLQPTNGSPARASKGEPLATRAPLSGARSFSEGLPDYLRPAPWTQRFAPVAGVALVLLAAVGALMLDRDLARGLLGMQPAKPAQEAPVEPGAAASEVAATGPEASTQPAAESAPKTSPAETAAPPVSAVATLPPGIDPTPPPDAPEVMPPMPVQPTAPATVTSEPAKVAATTPAEAPAAAPLAPAPKPTLPPAEPAPPRIVVPMQYTSTEGVLLRYEPSDQHWYVQPRRSELHPEEKFACPDPYDATFDLDSGRVQATLLGESVVEILPPTAELRIRLRLHRGRLILQRGPAGQDQPVRLAIAAGEQSWTTELLAPETILGVEVQPRSLYRYEPPMNGVWYQAAAFVGRGSVRFPKADDNGLTQDAGSMRWLAPPPADEPPASEALTAAWLDPQQRQSSLTLRRYASLLEREFDPQTAIDLSIPALVKDSRPKIAELAVRCLAITEVYPALVAALSRSDHAEARMAAAAGIRAWLIQSADRQAVLQRELASHYPGDEALPVYRLLLGITPQEARDKGVSLQLVDYLRSNYVEVRELAIGQLERLANRRYDYRPLGTPSQRDPAIQRWMSHVEREGAIVKPE